MEALQPTKPAPSKSVTHTVHVSGHQANCACGWKATAPSKDMIHNLVFNHQRGLEPPAPVKPPAPAPAVLKPPVKPPVIPLPPPPVKLPVPSAPPASLKPTEPHAPVVPPSKPSVY